MAVYGKVPIVPPVLTGTVSIIVPSNQPDAQVYRKGRSYEYKGPREYRGIVEHMKEQGRPPSKLVSSIGQMNSALDRTETSILGFFTDSTAPLYQEYMAAAQEFRGITHVASMYCI